jgi:hypothetical protein
MLAVVDIHGSIGEGACVGLTIDLALPLQIITFDENGVTGHVNHEGCYNGVRCVRCHLMPLFWVQS